MVYIVGKPIPPLRQDLDVQTTVHEGQPVVVLSDLLGLEDGSYAVPLPAWVVASLFDGKKTAAAIKNDLAPHQVNLDEAAIQSIADQLEEIGLLETAATQERREKAFHAFRTSTIRPSLNKIRGLPENALDLALFLAKYYQPPQGPGEPKTAGALGPAPLGLVSPHIDLHRGGSHYAWAYGALAAREKPDVVVALGVAHHSPNSPWVMTKKSYDTPFGPQRVHGALYEEIKSALWYDPLDDEWVHAREHSLEFQALWLKYLWRDAAPEWVPILCSNFERFCGDKAPSKIPTIEAAIEQMSGILQARRAKGQKILVLAGIDLAHVGKRFGDEMDITDEVTAKITKADKASLESAWNLDADSFFLAGSGDNSWRKICGLSALYTSLRLIKGMAPKAGAAGRELAYGQAPDPSGGVVSFVSGIFDEGKISS